MKAFWYPAGEAVPSIQVSSEFGDGDLIIIRLDTVAEREQAGVLVEALEVYAERNQHYHDNWKRMGWRGQLIRVRERAERLWDGLWHEVPGAPGSLGCRTGIDDALDMINFAGFLVRAVRESNRDGSWWTGT